MYYYVYDSFLNDPKYNKIINQVEIQLTDLGISGRIGRLSLLNNARELIEDQIKRGVKTIVVVGNDKTVNDTINIIADQNVIVGIIPIGEPGDNKIAASLGINNPTEACEILSKRIIKTIDLGKINNQYFISNVKIKNARISLECDDKYKVQVPKGDSEVNIYNLKTDGNNKFAKKYFNPSDGNLTTVIQPAGTKLQKIKNFIFRIENGISESIFMIKKIAISDDGKEVSIGTDGTDKLYTTPALVEIVPDKLMLIVGKNRAF